MDARKIFKVISIAATIIGGVAGIVSELANSKVQDSCIDEKIAEALKAKGIE